MELKEMKINKKTVSYTKPTVVGTLYKEVLNVKTDMEAVKYSKLPREFNVFSIANIQVFSPGNMEINDKDKKVLIAVILSD